VALCCQIASLFLDITVHGEEMAGLSLVHRRLRA